MNGFRFSAFDPTCCSVKPHRLFLSSYRWARIHATSFILGLTLCTRKAEAGPRGYWIGTEFYSGCIDFSRGGPFLKPVMRTNSFSRAAAASGALFSPVGTECTAWI